jgi:hypothetical protein
MVKSMAPHITAQKPAHSAAHYIPCSALHPVYRIASRAKTSPPRLQRAAAHRKKTSPRECNHPASSASLQRMQPARRVCSAPRLQRADTQ